MRPAHRGEAVAFVQHSSELRINTALVITLMRDDPILDQPIGFRYQRRSLLGRRIV